MEEYQQRVVDEKIKALSSFIFASPVYAKMPAKQQALLTVQCEFMKAYSGVLGQRISLFDEV